MTPGKAMYSFLNTFYWGKLLLYLKSRLKQLSRDKTVTSWPFGSDQVERDKTKICYRLG